MRMPFFLKMWLFLFRHWRGHHLYSKGDTVKNIYSKDGPKVVLESYKGPYAFWNHQKDQPDLEELWEAKDPNSQIVLVAVGYHWRKFDEQSKNADVNMLLDQLLALSQTDDEKPMR